MGKAERAGSTVRAPHQLPSGRHGLQRSFVAQNQRERILSAVAKAAAALGYADMTVEAIIEQAGVSRPSTTTSRTKKMPSSPPTMP